MITGGTQRPGSVEIAVADLPERPEHGQGPGSATAQATGLRSKPPSQGSTPPRRSLDGLNGPDVVEPAGPAPLPGGPVFNPVTGDLDRTHLRQAVRALVAELPQLPPTATASQTTLKARIAANLQQMAQLAAADSTMPAHQLGLELRHRCKAASRAAASLAHSLHRSHPDLGLEYCLMGAIFNEMKRTHLSGAAKPVLDDYATRQAQHLNDVCGGMGERRAGAVLVSTKGGGASWGPNTPSEVVALDVGGQTARNLLWFVDDQNSVFVQEYASGHAEVNLTALAIGKWGGKARFRAGTNYVGNDAVGTRMVGGPSLKDVVKVYNDIEAEKSWIKSADPKLSATIKLYQKARNILTTGPLGRVYAKEPGAPTYLSHSKIAKGFNATKLQLLVDAVETLRQGRPGETGQLRALLRTAYPSVHETIVEARDDDQPLPQLGIHNALPKEAFYGHAYGPFANGKFTVQKSLDESTLEARGAQVSPLALDWDTLFFPNWLPHLAHQTLDFSFAKDAAQTMHAHAKLDKLIGPHAPNPKPPMLHLYAAVARHLGGCDIDVTTAPPIDNADRKYYQSRTQREVPTQFIDGINNPDPSKLLRAAEVAWALGELRVDFVEQAHTLTARPENSLDATVRDKLQEKRQAAFDTVNERIWGGRYPGGRKAALKDPEKFVALTHGALSLAFGAAGTHLSIQKRQMQARGMTNALDAAAVRNADTSYKLAREVFDHDNLNMPQQKLGEGRNTPLNVYQMFRRHTVGTTVTVSGGWEADTINAVAQAGGASTVEVPVDGNLVSPSAVSRVANGMLTVRAKFQNMDLQDSASRQGKYLQFEVTAVSGGLLSGRLLEKAAGEVMEKLGISQEKNSKTSIMDCLREIGGMGLSLEDGAKVAIRLRKAPGNHGYDLEYVRPLKVKDHGLLATVKVETPEHVIKPSAISLDHVEMPGFEIRGPDLYYLIAQHSGLKRRLRQETGSVANLFANHPEMVAAYCGSASMIPTVIDRYMTAMTTPHPTDAQRNEFHRFFKDEPFKRAAKLARDVASHAPGSRAESDAPFRKPASLKRQVRMPAGLDWQAAKTQIAALPDAAARAAYFSTGNGLQVFHTFVSILDKVAEVDAAVSMHHDEKRTFGFYSELNPELAKVAKEADRRAAGGSPSVFQRVKDAWPLKAKPPATSGTQYPFGTLPDSGPLGTILRQQGYTPEARIDAAAVAPQRGGGIVATANPPPDDGGEVDVGANPPPDDGAGVGVGANGPNAAT